MDDRQARHRRLAAAGILQSLLEYSPCEAVRAAQDLTEKQFEELTAAVADTNHNRGVLRAMAALEKPRAFLQPRPYHTFAEPAH